MNRRLHEGRPWLHGRHLVQVREIVIDDDVEHAIKSIMYALSLSPLPASNNSNQRSGARALQQQRCWHLFSIYAIYIKGGGIPQRALTGAVVAVSNTCHGASLYREIRIALLRKEKKESRFWRANTEINQSFQYRC